MAVLPWILGASVAADLVGSLFSSGAQKQANEQNLILGRETNALNEKMFNTNLDFQREMWQKSNEWNSPANQAALLKQAGFNPNMLFGQGGQSLASVPSGAHGQAAPFAPMQPVDAFAKGIKNAGVDLANTYLSLSQAQKAKEESIGVATENKYKAAQLSKNLELLGKNVEAQELYNEYQRKTLDARIEHSKLDNAFLSESTNNLVADTALKNVTQKLESAKIKLTKKQIKELDSVIKKNISEANYYVSAQELNKIGVKESQSRIVLNYINGEMSRLVGTAQAGMYNAQGAMYGQQARYTKEDTRLLEKFGEQIKKAGIAEARTAADVNVATKIKVMREVKKLDKDLHWYDFDEIWGAFTDWMSAVKPPTGGVR